MPGLRRRMVLALLSIFVLVLSIAIWTRLKAQVLEAADAIDPRAPDADVVIAVADLLLTPPPSGDITDLFTRVALQIPSPLPECDSWVVPHPDADKRKLAHVTALVATPPLNASKWCLLVTAQPAELPVPRNVIVVDAKSLAASALALPLDLVVKVVLLMIKPKLVFLMHAGDEILYDGVDLNLWRLRLLFPERFEFESSTLLQNVTVWSLPRPTLVNAYPDFNPRRFNATAKRALFTFVRPARLPAELVDSARVARSAINATDARVPVVQAAIVHFLPNAPPLYFLSPQPDHIRGIALAGPLTPFEGSALFRPAGFFALFDPLAETPGAWSLVVGRCLQHFEAHLILAAPVTLRRASTPGAETALPLALVNFIVTWSVAGAATLDQCVMRLVQDLHNAALINAQALGLAQVWAKFAARVIPPGPAAKTSVLPTAVVARDTLETIASRTTFAILVRTYAGDKYVEKYLINSLQAFCDFDRFDVVLVLDYESANDQNFAVYLYLRYGIRALFQRLPANWRNMFVSDKDWGNGQSRYLTGGYQRQNWGTLYLDEASASDVLGILDADSPLRGMLTRTYMFVGNKPPVLHLNANARDVYAGDAVMLNISQPAPLDAMSAAVFPMYFYRDTLASLREYVRARHKASSFDAVWGLPGLHDYNLTAEEICRYLSKRNAAGNCKPVWTFPGMSNFNLLANYAAAHEQHLYYANPGRGRLRLGVHKLKWFTAWKDGQCVMFDPACDPRRGVEPYPAEELRSGATALPGVRSARERQDLFLDYYLGVRDEFATTSASSQARMWRALQRGYVGPKDAWTQRGRR